MEIVDYGVNEAQASVLMSFDALMSVVCPLKLRREPKQRHNTLPRVCSSSLAAIV